MKNNSLIELKLEEQININGGEPTKETDFFYDAFWYITGGIKKYLYHDSGNAYMCM
ncbi:hypothetical protein [Polaribacter staleyi]|uniref:hypothetical protein n=1 Tax=Polaribacter staleyi TaxID=2022337 RepID=UPI0031BAF2CC